MPSSSGQDVAALARLVPDPAAVKPKLKDKRQRRRRNRRRKHGHEEQQYPVFTTCHTETNEVGPIPGGPYPTCQSDYDPDEFGPCDPRYTLEDLQRKCHDAYPACNGDCGILSEPAVGVGDCPDLSFCNYYSYEEGCLLVTIGGIPGGRTGRAGVGRIHSCAAIPARGTRPTGMG